MPEVQIVVIEGPDEGREFEVSGSTTVGRDPSAGLVIDDGEASRRHASLSVEGDTVTVEDLGSTNGTFVNGQRLTEAHKLAVGEKLRIGTTVFELRAAPAQATQVGTALPDLDDIQVTAPRNVPDFARAEPPAGPPTAQQPSAPPSPPQTTAPPPSVGPPGGAPPFQPPPPAGPSPSAAPPPPAGGPPPPPSSPPPSFAPPPAAPPQAAPAYGGPPVPYGGGAMTQGGYPITVEGDYPQEGISRWRVFFQGLLAYPHFIVLFFVAIAAYFALIGAFFSILFTRRYPQGIFNFVAGTLRWSTRVNAFAYLMTERYPPFSLADEPQYPVRVQFRYPENGIARWRALFQGLLAIPHIIVLYLLAIAQFLAFIIAWFSILFTRNYPPGVFNFILGCMRWQTRVIGYYLWMTEEYPPFSLE